MDSIITGVTGDRGDKGIDGDPGVKGLEGDDGIKGIRGDKGETGDRGASGEDRFMTQSLWFGWSRWTWVRLAFAFLSLMGTWGLYQNTRQDNHRERDQKIFQEAQVQRGINDDYNACLRGNDTRQVIRNILELDDGITDLTVLPGFDELDQDTKQFFINIRDISIRDAEAGESFKQMALALLTIRDCEAEYPEADVRVA